jgi:Ca2+-binding EF-hand superfamily protein
VRVEKAKRDVNYRYDWSARSAFDTIDTIREYFLNHRNIQNFLRINGFLATDAEVIAIIRRLDSDGDSRVAFEEFAEALRPAVPVPSPVPVSSASNAYEESKRSSSPLRRTATSPLRASELDSRPSLASSYVPSSPVRAATLTVPASTYLVATSSPSRRYSPLKLDDENELVRAFKEQIALENELEDAKNRLAQQSDFNLPDAFDLLDRLLLGSVSSTEIADTLASFGVYALSEDVFLFVKRYDRNLDGRLGFNEFSSAFMPKLASLATTL